ncbi:protein of unknown function UPF0102 [Thermobaculum terrenum ATCC BAA-798]|uniref:UPF0102 protein Tter_1272 n=1 Tax=Thermobaculum terrenum (strain ATCC BAA-798 / CCMEE 7001 / YNP1) TaxID=525904 RepID=D1CBL5_THET1|nr:YraN family protein [Thermobaculum terrenum]ACZ42180.1 protein of unknown function UPF0102 [Thermobaculum terrenum ATCC BAA-798]
MSKSLGRIGEDYACNFLLSKGYKLIARNWRCRQGEIDIIFQDKDEIVFVEVKTRSSLSLGTPEESIDMHKARQLLTLAKIWIFECYDGEKDPPVRFDAVTVTISRSGRVIDSNHIQNCIMPGDYD